MTCICVSPCLSLLLPGKTSVILTCAGVTCSATSACSSARWLHMSSLWTSQVNDNGAGVTVTSKSRGADERIKLRDTTAAVFVWRQVSLILLVGTLGGTSRRMQAGRLAGQAEALVYDDE